MSYNQAYNAYKKASVTTASQGELVVLLYDEAVKKLSTAVSFFDLDGKIPVQDIEEFSSNLLKAQEIITELQVSLDMEKGGEISRNLMALYVYFNQELTSANISKSKEKIDFVLNMMEQLSESWHQVANTTTTSSANVQQALNIKG